MFYRRWVGGMGWQRGVDSVRDAQLTGTFYDAYTQRRVQPDQCYFTVQITGINFECSL